MGRRIPIFNKVIISPTFLVTSYAHANLLFMCIDSIKKFYPESRIIISQQINDESEIDIEGTKKIYHDMKQYNWSEVAIGLLKECNTDIAILMDHDAFLLNHLDNYLELIENGSYDLIGPEDVIPFTGLNRNSPGMMCQNFLIINAKKMKEIGLDNVRFKDDEKYKDFANKESCYGMSQSLEKKLFMPVTKSNYAHGTYYGSEVFHLWYGSFRERNVLDDGVNPKMMEDESIALIKDYWSGSYRTTGIKLPLFENKRKYAVCMIAHKEKDIIEQAINQWAGFVDKVLVLVSNKSWNGNSIGDDDTIAIANRCADEVVVGEWKTEAEQRSWGLARLYDYDYVIMVDPDEFFTEVDKQKIISELNKPAHLEYTPDFQNLSKVPAFKYKSIITYWKTLDYILDPPDEYKNTIVIDPKQLYCYEHRQFKPGYSEYATTPYVGCIDVTCHHLSWVKTDEKVKEKIASFSHADSVYKDWYEDIWLGWKPGDNIQLRPYGTDKSMAVKYEAPKEIIDLLDK